MVTSPPPKPAGPAPLRGVVSFQSQVVYGHVGNAAAGFALERLGLEVWPVPTVLFSNHPGHGGFAGERLAPGALSALVQGLAERGFLARARAVLSGYLGLEAQAGVVADTVAAVKRSAPHTPYCCDPVIGDVRGGVYVGPGIPEAIRDRLLPLADLVTPNAFELGWLTGAPVGGWQEALAAARGLARPMVMVTSVPLAGDALGTLLVTAQGAWLTRTARVSAPPGGTGDLCTALFLGHWLEGCAPPEALARAVTGTDAVIRVSADAGSPELLLSAAQDAMLARSDLVAVETVG